jgi:4-hydroxybenzoate polyprenyltransferase
MAFNRVADSDIDAINPRTNQREIPAGLVTAKEGRGVVLLSAGIFLTASYALGWHCLVCAPPVLILLWSYSLLKRYTALCHFVLGVALGLAPGGVWYALTAEFAVLPVWLMVGVTIWVAGFDILYSCQDRDFDIENSLFSVPAWLGVKRSILVAALCHVSAVALLVVFGVQAQLGIFYMAGVVLFGIFIAAQYWDIAREGIGCINRSFFTRNGFASVGILVATVIDWGLT